MTRKRLMYLGVTAMAVLLAGCGTYSYLLQKKLQDQLQDQLSKVSDDAIIVQGTADLPTESDIYY